MASGIPKRAANAKKKDKRARNKAKNEKLKPLRIAEQEKRHTRNLKLGTNAKQRANSARKLNKALANSGDFAQYIELEDLLEM